MRKTIKLTLMVLLSVALLFWLSYWFAIHLFQPWFWTRQVGYDQIFWRVLAIKWTLVGITFALVFACTWLNLRYARRIITSLGEGDATKGGISRIAEIPSWLRVWISVLVALALGWESATHISPGWKTYLNYRWGGSFGQVDPIFGRDIGYYVFSLPFYQMLEQNLVRLLLIQLAVILFVYFYSGCIRLSLKQPWVRNQKIIRQLSLHFLLGLCILGWGFYLDRYALLYTSTGVVYGVGYTADHVQSATLVVMALVSFLSAVVVAVSLYTRRYSRIVWSVCAAFASYLLLVVAIPGLVQRYVVVPSELQLETPT